jgi:hypothetical protein
MCWVCEHLGNLITSWNEEQEFQEQTSSDDYHRGLSKGFSECIKDLSDAVASMRLKGICQKLPEYIVSLDEKQRFEILDNLLKLRDEDSNQE